MSTESEKLATLCKLNYKDQAIYFLNGFWGDGIGPDEANLVWEFHEHFVKLDLLGPDRKGEEGNELDQFWAAKFIEDKFSAITALERKAAFAAIDQDNNGKMALLELLMWKYKKPASEVVVAPQGDNTAAIAAAQAKLDAVKQQMAECEAKLESQKAAKAENESAMAALAASEQQLKTAEVELQAAIDDLKKEEEAYNGKIRALEATIADESTSGMKKARANNELAQLKSEDPLPLRRAKITQEAALRKVQKQQKEVAKKRVEAEAKQAALEAAIADLEAAYVDLEAKMADTQSELEKIKSKPGGGKGAVYWMERGLFEADAFLPTSRQKYNHKAPFQFTA